MHYMEHHAPRTHDYEQSTTSVLRCSSFEALRAKQREVYYERFDPDADHDDPVSIEQIDESVNEYLADNGIDESHPFYNTLHGSVRRMSYDKISDSKWQYGEWEDPDDPDSRLINRGINELYRTQELLLGERIDDETSADTTHVINAENEPLHESPETRFEILEKKVEDARELLAIASAKRQGKFFSFKSKRYEGLKKDYNEKVQALGRRHLDEHPDYDDNDQNLVVIAFLFNEQEQLRDRTTKELEKTKVTKFIKWMNKGNAGTKIAKGVVIGAGAGLAGSFLAGAVGAGIIAGGAVTATRFARGFALKDHDKRGMDGLDDTIDLDEYSLGESARSAPAEDRLLALTKKADADFDVGTKYEQEKRRKAALYGTALIGAGALAGYGIHQAIEWGAGRNLTAWDSLKDWWNDTPDDTASRPGGRVPDSLPEDTPEPKAPDFSWTDFSPQSRVVESGEGWYQTFQELGIPESHWEDTLQNAGPKLENAGWAYYDDAAGEYRISHQGELSDRALTIIARSARRDGFDLAA